MAEKASLKQRIHRGDIIQGVGVPMGIDRPRLEAILGQGSYDYVSVDSQHEAFSEDRLVAVCAMAEDLDIPVMFRITHTRHAYLIGRYLDLGPSSIMVPEVKDEATADDAIAFFYYPQVGRRSWGGNARRGITARPDRLEYAAWWNDYGVLCIQLESVDAITNARRLAKPGIDFVTFGPNDLSYSLEAYPEHPFKTVDDCVRHVVAQLKGSDVRVGMGARTPEERARYIEMGVTVF